MAEPPVIVPVHHIVDSRAKWRREQLPRFWSHIWPEAVQDFASCGILLESALRPGEVRRSPGGRPIFVGLTRGVINFVITDHIPIQWDRGRGLTAVTTRYDGCHVCMVALQRAHGHQVPFLSVNTCVHELLHALLQDIYEVRPKGSAGAAREFRIDVYATRLWLFRDGAAIRNAARSYVERLRSERTSEA
jgi:hypothetical protein